eukprot:4008209-Amphidinium_carterae.1
MSSLCCLRMVAKAAAKPSRSVQKRDDKKVSLLLAECDFATKAIPSSSEQENTNKKAHASRNQNAQKLVASLAITFVC